MYTHLWVQGSPTHQQAAPSTNKQHHPPASSPTHWHVAPPSSILICIPSPWSGTWWTYRHHSWATGGCLWLQERIKITKLTQYNIACSLGWVDPHFPFRNAAYMLLASFGQILACYIQVTHIHIPADDVCCTYAENLGACKTNLCLPAHVLHACTHMQHTCATCRCAVLTPAHMQHAYCSYRLL